MISSVMQDDFPLNLNHVLRRMGSVYPESKVVTVRDSDGTVETSTFLEVTENASRLARGLQELGVREGDRVGSLAWNVREHLELYLAVPCMGAVLHTLNLRLHPEQIAFTVNHAEDKVLVVEESLLGLFEQVSPLLKTVEKVVVIGGDKATTAAEGRVAFDDLITGDPDFQWPEVPENAGAGLCYTSGTTGDPKGVLYSHRSLTLHTLIEAGHDRYRLSSEDRVLAIVPMFHAMAWNLPYFCAMNGTDLILPGRHMQAPMLAELIESQKVTVSAGVPTIWMDLLRHAEEANLRYDSLRMAICGGSTVPLGLMQEFEDRHDVYVVQGWGMTETLPGVTMAHDPPEVDDEDMRWQFRSTIGRISPLYELRVVGEDDVELPNDGVSIGEIEIRGPVVAGGYYGIDDPAGEKFHDGWLRTGDAGTIDSQGWVRLSDRLKDLIKSGGEWISSAELESNLMEHPRVREAAVIARPDERWGERPLAFIDLDGEVDREELQAFLEERVAKWWIPDEFIEVEAIPKTSVGKFDKKRLRSEMVSP